MSKGKKEFLTGEEIKKATFERVDRYTDLTFLEQFAMFVGKAQILEFGLKKLLQSKYNVEWEMMEKWTLGKTASELEKQGLRPDFISNLRDVVDHRNYIAHELLVNQSITQGFFGQFYPENHYDKESRRLHKAIFILERIMLIFDWLQENDGWD